MNTSFYITTTPSECILLLFDVYLIVSVETKVHATGVKKNKGLAMASLACNSL